MAERMKDKEDLRLEALFRSDPIDDDGFSVRVVTKVRHRIWVRRLSLPIAVAIGALVSAKPVVQVVTALPALTTSIFGSAVSLERLSLDHLPQLSTVLFGAALAMALFLAGRLLED